MTVAELVEILSSETNQDREVILARDAEGNGYSPASGAETGKYRDGWFGLEQLDDDLRSQGYTEEDVMIDGLPAMVIYPR